MNKTNNKNKKCIAVLSSTAIGVLIASALTTSVSAKVQSYVVDDAGKVISFGLEALQTDYINHMLGKASPMFDAYLQQVSNLTAFQDSIKGFVSYEAVEKAYTQALLKGEGSQFNIDNITENAAESDINDITVGYVAKEDGSFEETVPSGQVTVTSVDDVTSVSVDKGTTAEGLNLPSTVGVALSDGTVDVADVTWDTSAFNGTNAGETTISGTLSVPEGKTWTIPAAKKQVNIIVSVSENVTQDFVTITNSDDLLASSEGDKLVADGKTVVTLKVQLLDKDGNTLKGVTGNVAVASKIDGVKSAQAETAFDVNDNGIARLNITLNNSEIEEQDTLTVTVTKCSEASYKGKQASIKLKYVPKSNDGGSETTITRTYKATVESADLADRVKVRVPGVLGQDVDTVKEEILNDVIVISKDVTKGKSYNHKLVKIIKDTVLKEQPTQADHVYTVLLEKEAYDATGATYANNVEYVLQDNSNNYYTIADSNKNIKLEPVTTEKSFMVIDGELPRLTQILFKNDADSNDLPYNALVAVFSEDVDRATAEDPNNWVINGHNLSESNGLFKYIKQLDVTDKDTKEAKGIQNTVGENNLRNAVVIQLTPKGAKYLTEGENLIQAKSIGDAASVTDLSDNNKILTQDFIFSYEAPAFQANFKLDMESPEQFILSTPEIYNDENTETVKSLCNKDESANNLTIKLGDVDVTKYFRVVKLDESIASGYDEKYILELTQDWTTISEIDNTYHNKTLTVTLNNGYDVYGKEYKIDTETKLVGSVVVTEDVTSPAIKTDSSNANGLAIDYIGYDKDKSVKYSKVIYNLGTGAGKMAITMTEPVQLINDASEGAVSGFSPATTPSVEEGSRVPVTNLEYVKLDDSGKSTGKIVKGEVVSVTDEHDNKFTVVPVSDLDAGDWKLVVRAISDDVGNTMKTTDVDASTAAVKFTVVKDAGVVIGEPNVDPYVLWAYADDNKVDADGTTNDYVYILYSKKMNIDALRASTYNVNSKQVTQDASITSKDVPLYLAYVDANGKNVFYDSAYHPELQGQLVTIKLPSSFIVGGDDIDGDGTGIKRKNVLTIPTTLTDKAGTTLKLDNNALDNQYELSFKRSYAGEALVIGGKQVVPAIDVQASANASKVKSVDDYCKVEGNGNKEPVVDGTIDGATVIVGGTTEQTITNISDPDGDVLTYSAVSSDESVATVTTSGNVVTITGVALGTADIKVAADDGKGGKVSETFAVTVTAADRTELDAAIVKAKTYKEADYTADSYKVLTDAVAAAEDLLPAATQAEVDAAKEAVDAAIEGLKSEAVTATITDVDSTTLMGTTMITATLPEGVDGSKYELTVSTKDGKTAVLKYYETTKKFVGSLSGTYSKDDLTVTTKAKETVTATITDVDSTTLMGTTMITATLPEGVDGSKYELTVSTKDGKTAALKYYETTKKFVGSLSGTYSKDDLTIVAAVK